VVRTATGGAGMDKPELTVSVNALTPVSKPVYAEA